MPSGYTETMLHGDLATRRIDVDEATWQWSRTCVEGSAFAPSPLRRVPAQNVNSLESDNILKLAASVISGPPVSGANRIIAASESPHIDRFGESETGGCVGPELKSTGFDAMAEKPVGLSIFNGVFDQHEELNWMDCARSSSGAGYAEQPLNRQFFGPGQ
ncbi:aldehyde ferredoxin oxidoreductase N-terminal domain-containing protein [Oceanidesulfovibrio marinus]|uniref:Aldehyde ferredoxin oxidoreductase N-terminal domain-containing protein n=1 Tax=Oceanidesulfovibrio marinus TaxID=370038 RepID=A0A6P1ZF93_9BACT|nr:aldehyde ferredoxin oxidoreductase N-terminal domain-containing protein [Oceanidesulfovibrio marinus]TVM32456.1 hypothetical protein DQK91_14350 [Oceanidesulfovibrio marinus]